MVRRCAYFCRRRKCSCKSCTCFRSQKHDIGRLRRDWGHVCHKYLLLVIFTKFDKYTKTSDVRVTRSTIKRWWDGDRRLWILSLAFMPSFKIAITNYISRCCRIMMTSIMNRMLSVAVPLKFPAKTRTPSYLLVILQRRCFIIIYFNPSCSFIASLFFLLVKED